MKKAKIMLFLISVIAVVGGALAFKAKAFGGLSLYISTTFLDAYNHPQPTCVITDPFNNYTIDIDNPALTFTCVGTVGLERPDPQLCQATITVQPI